MNSQDIEGNTPPMVALENGHEELAMILFHTGRCNPHVTNNKGENCAHIAARKGQLVALDWLRRHAGVNMLVLTRDGKSIFDYSADQKVTDWLLVEFQDYVKKM